MRTKYSGFTLVEVLVISPVVILFIGFFIALLVTLTGDSLITREKNNVVHDTQSALDDIEASVSQATRFLTTTGPTPIPQGKNNATAGSTGIPFTNTTSGSPDALIIKSPATTKNPTDPARSLIYMGSGACDSTKPLYTLLTVYFVADDLDTSDTSDKALFKRTILPQTSACGLPWQRGSCLSTLVTSSNAVCDASDEKLVSGVSSFDVTYFIGPNTSTPDSNAQAASDITASLSISKQVAGSTVAYSAQSTASSQNIEISATPEPETPPPANTDIFSMWGGASDPYKATFFWESAGNATSYNFRYRVGGGAWTQQTVDSAAFFFSVDANARKQVIDVELDIVSANGTYRYGTTSTTPTPRWTECTPQSGWQNYDPSYYNTLGFTKTSSGAVGLKGLVRLGQIGYTSSTKLCTLPEKFRPSTKSTFYATSNDNDPATGYTGAARVDILANGDVLIVSTPGGNNGWVSLEGIIFMSADSNPPWQNSTYGNGWSAHGAPHSGLRHFKDSRGRVWVEGHAVGGVQNVGVNYSMPASMAPQYGGLHIPTSSAGRGSAVNINTSPLIVSRASAGGDLSTHLMYYATGGLNSITNWHLQSGWVAYANGWSQPACYKGTDDIVVVQGLITGGNATYGSLVVNLASLCGNGSSNMSTGRAAILPVWRNWERPGRFDFQSNGDLIVVTADTGWTSMDGIHYIAD